MRNSNIPKQAVSYEQLIKLPVAMRKFGDKVYKRLDHLLNTSQFSKMYKADLRHCQMSYHEISCDYPYKVYCEIEREGIAEYSAYVDASFYSADDCWRRPITVCCGFCDTQRENLVLCVITSL